MNKETEDKDKNISRRDFLKKMAVTAAFTAPTIKTFSLLQSNPYWTHWTGHGHGHGHGHNPKPPK